MKTPAQADIDAAKRSALAKGTTAELLTFDDLDVAVIVHAMTPAGWAGYLDACARNQSDAIVAAYSDHVAWPSAAEADALAERIPAFTKLVVADLCNMAGRIAADPETFKLTADTPPSKLARTGLTPEKAAELLTRYPHPQSLTLARFPTFDVSTEGAGFSIVVKVPSRPVYNARIEVHDKAVKEASGIFDTCAQAARDFIVWTSEGESPDPIFATWPGAVSSDIYPLFERVGGMTAKSARRRL